MVLRYRVSLPGLKGFERIYEVKEGTTLYSLHKAMRSDMEFPQDQIILFKAVDADGKALARYSFADMGSGTVDEVTLAVCHGQGQDHFVYFYDTTNRKSVLLDYMGSEDGILRGACPALVFSKGPNPVEFENGYVAFEDLPEDKQRRLRQDPDDLDDEDFEDEDDDDLDEDGSGDEDGEEILGEEDSSGYDE